MKVVYLATTRLDIVWMRQYYTRIFPDGYKNARAHLQSAEKLLSEYPYAGHPSGIADIREILISRTPFSLIYRVHGGRVEVMRVWDNRSGRAAMTLP